MSNYDIGKDIRDIQMRLERLEQIVSSMLSVPSPDPELQDNSSSVETPIPSEAEKVMAKVPTPPKPQKKTEEKSSKKLFAFKKRK